MRSIGERIRGVASECLLTWIVCGACAALIPSTANAAPSRYIYEVCDSALPGGGTPEAHFSANPGAALSPSNSCAQPGGSLSITETGHLAATYGYWEVPIARPPGGTVEALTISGQSCAGAGNKIFVYEQGWPGNCGGETQRIFHISGFFLGGPWIFLGCDGNYAAGCEAGAFVYAHYFAATEVDPVSPTLSPPTGSLLGGGVIRGHQSLSVDASDEGGGLSKVWASVDGLPAVQPYVPNCNLVQVKNPSVVGTVAVTVTPCPASLKASWAMDTAAYPFHDGANTVQVCAADFASLNEPNTTCSAAQTVNIDNSCTESSVGGGEVLSTHFDRSHDDEITVPFNHPANVSGELANNAGDAISGATICVQMQTVGSQSGLVPVGTATTDAQGHFTYTVPPGPNRRILVGYRHDTFQVARSVRYYAHAKPSLRITPSEVRSGGRVRIAGSVPGPGAAGRVVVLQASALHSSRWFTFHRATANHRGVFHSRYRFDATTQTTTYRIRAVIPRQGGYPWEVGHSRPALVEVRAGR